jgi:hypothetical protein
MDYQLGVLLCPWVKPTITRQRRAVLEKKRAYVRAYLPQFHQSRQGATLEAEA